jgi:hypothetical protein
VAIPKHSTLLSTPWIVIVEVSFGYFCLFSVSFQIFITLFGNYRLKYASIERKLKYISHWILGIIA